MKFILVVVLYVAQPHSSVDPRIMLKPMVDKEHCESALNLLKQQPLPDGIEAASVCVSVDELLGSDRA